MAKWRLQLSPQGIGFSVKSLLFLDLTPRPRLGG
jgi:hypothetical protein